MAGDWDVVIFDEVHHLSERCRESLMYFDIYHSISLSATVSRDMRKALKDIFPDLYIYKVTTKQAITDEVLPDPRVFLIPLSLDATTINQEIIKNKSQKITLEIPYSMRFQYAKVKNRRIVIKCTQRQYYDDMSTMIEWYKRKMYGSEVMKNLFLRKSGERLKWLSEQKTAYVKALLDLLRDQRTLTFCNGIPQTAELGKYCINSSKSKGENAENLGKFNSGKVKHITACNMLDEGMNLVNCRVGVYAVLNSSERMIKQKLGRLLRHSDPIIIIPYYVGTRDEELVNKMMEDYNPELVTKITSLTQLKL
jgi:superfamily II DNA or RNA helicase